MMTSYIHSEIQFKHFNFMNNFSTLSPMCITANPLKQPSRLWWAGWQPLLPRQQGQLGRESRATGVSKIIMETKLYNGHNLPPTFIGFNIWSKFDGDLFTTLSYVPAKVFLGCPRTVCFTGFLVLRIVFFFSKITMNFLRKILWKMLCLFCNTTQAADNNKVLSEENKRLVWNFFKNSQLFDISDEKRKFSKHYFSQKVGETYPRVLLYYSALSWLHT